MTEAEWLEYARTRPMLRWLDENGSVRKLRLFACACCRAVWYLLLDARSRKSVEVAEAFADGFATESELAEAHLGARIAAWSLRGSDGISRRLTHPPESYFPDDEPIDGWWESSMLLATAEAAVIRKPTRHEFSITLGGNDTLDAWYSYTPYTEVVASLSSLFGVSDEDREARDAAGTKQLAFLRDIFGNPFRPITFDPAWRTDTALSLARQMHESRDFGAMPILADALQDAGCDNEDILSHCRDATATHVLGCWVIDLVSGVS
jgi:hypothetical protein